jgi:hypothetical protein
VVTPDAVNITVTPENVLSVVKFDELQNVRIDNKGRFFFIVAGKGGNPLCLVMTPWIAPALALMMAGAARRGNLKELETEIEHRAQSL